MQGHMAPSYSILEEPWACNKNSMKVPTDWSLFFLLGGIFGRFCLGGILFEKVIIPKSAFSCSGLLLGDRNGMPSKRCVFRFGSEKDIFDEFDTDFTGKLLGMNS